MSKRLNLGNKGWMYFHTARMYGRFKGLTSRIVTGNGWLQATDPGRSSSSLYNYRLNSSASAVIFHCLTWQCPWWLKYLTEVPMSVDMLNWTLNIVVRQTIVNFSKIGLLPKFRLGCWGKFQLSSHAGHPNECSHDNTIPKKEGLRKKIGLKLNTIFSPTREVTTSPQAENLSIVSG